MDSIDSAAPPATVHLDLDGAVHVYRTHGWRYEAPSDPLFVTGLSAFLEWFDAVGVRATLFVIAEDLHNPAKLELLQEASRQGHEIASHSMTHRHLTSLSDQDKDRELRGSRDMLGEVLGGRVAGFRAPGFDIDRRCLELIDEAGYGYDSSLFPRRSRRGRIVAGGASPHRPLNDRELLELPLPCHSPLPLPFHPSYSLVIGLWYFRLGLMRFRRTGSPLSLLFHLTDLADPLPPDMLRGRAQSLFTLSYLRPEQKRSRCDQMLGMVKKYYRLCSTETMVEGMRKAAKAIPTSP